MVYYRQNDTVCLTSSDPTLYNKVLYKTGHYFLDIQYAVSKASFGIYTGQVLFSLFGPHIVVCKIKIDYIILQEYTQ